MKVCPRLSEGSQPQSVRSKLVIIEALIFLLPLLILFYILRQGNYHFELPQVILFSVITLFVLAGMVILRQIIDRLYGMAVSLRKAAAGEKVVVEAKTDILELQDMSCAVTQLLAKLEETTEALAHKAREVGTLQESAEIARLPLSLEDRMERILEKSLVMTGASIGSVLIVDSADAHRGTAGGSHFRVGAVCGQGAGLRKGECIAVEGSLLERVLREKTALRVLDIEKDERTCRVNDPRYGGPSFLSLPVMVGDAVAAVVNLAGRPSGQPFAAREEQLLSLVLREVGIVLENVLLQGRIMEQLERIEQHQAALDRESQERRLTEQALRESEAKFRLLVEKSSDIIYTTDLEGAFTYLNPVTERLTGYTAAELMGKRILSLIRPDFRERIETLSRQQVAERLSSSYTEFPIVTRDGNERWLGQYVQLLLKEGRPAGFQAVVRDITEGKNAEAALRASENRYRTLVGNIPDVVVVIDQAGQVSAVNETAARYGFSEADLIGKPFLEWIHPEDRERVMEDWQQAIREHREVTRGLEFRILGKDGQLYWAELTARKLWDDQGAFLREEGVLRDVTERKQEEERIVTLNGNLAEANQKLEAAYTWMRENRDRLLETQARDVTGLLVDREGKIRGTTENALERFGKTRDQLLGAPLTELLVEADREPFLAELNRAWVDIDQGIEVGIAAPRDEGERVPIRMTRLALGGERLLLVTLQ